MSLDRKYRWATQYLDQHYPHFVDAETIFESKVQEFLQKDTIMLDAGCGKGQLLEKWRPAVKLAIGIDADEKSITGTACQTDVVIGDLENLPFKEKTFDLITCRWVVEHLREPEKSFHEFSRILKNGGRLILLTPNAYGYVTILSRLMPLKVKKRLLNRLGRGESDTFATYYRCNSIRQLLATAKENHLTEENVVPVGSPYYLFFSKFLFRLAVMYEKLTDIDRLKGGKIHIVASFVKK